MPLTDLQKARIKYHLDITYSTAFEEVNAQFRLLLDSIDPIRQLQLVGNPTGDPPEYDYAFLGIPLCQTGSLLWKVERAFEKINPEEIDPSLFVRNTEEVALRANELQKRRSLYDSLVGDLRRVFDIPDSGRGLGYWGLGEK